MIGTNNVCMFQGRITKDPIYSSYTCQGQQGPYQLDKALFTIAVDRPLSSDQRQKARNGDKSIKTADFVPVSLTGSQVATLKQYFFKGKGITVLGHYEEYVTKDPNTGENKYGHTIVAERIGFTVQDPKNAQQGQPQQQQYQQPQQQYQQPQAQYQQPQQPQFGTPPQQTNFSMFDESNSPF